MEGNFPGLGSAGDGVSELLQQGVEVVEGGFLELGVSREGGVFEELGDRGPGEAIGFAFPVGGSVVGVSGAGGVELGSRCTELAEEVLGSGCSELDGVVGIAVEEFGGGGGDVSDGGGVELVWRIHRSIVPTKN